MTAKISVVIPLYNKELYIARALHSVLNQTEQDFEIIVVDDGSTDRSADVVDRFHDPRIRLIRQVNGGELVARNRGVCEAKAEFVAFLDADDEWMPRFLETLNRLRKRFPQAGIYCTSFINARSNGKTRQTRRVIAPPPPWEGIVTHYFLSAALGGPSVSASSAGVPKKILTEFNGFQTDSWYGGDADLWGRIALKYPIAFSWYDGAVYHEDALNRVCSRLEPLREHPFLNSAREIIGQEMVPDEILPDLMEYIAALKISIAARNICMGEPGLARPFLEDCDTKIFTWQKNFWIVCARLPPGLFSLLRRMARPMRS